MTAKEQAAILRRLASADRGVYGSGHTEREEAFDAGARALDLLALAEGAEPFEVAEENGDVNAWVAVLPDEGKSTVIAIEDTPAEACFTLIRRLIATALELRNKS